jgi:hypothetical protein
MAEGRGEDYVNRFLHHCYCQSDHYFWSPELSRSAFTAGRAAVWGRAVDRRLLAFASGERPGMRGPGAQSLRVMGPDARQVIKGVGDPVLSFRDSSRRSR